MREEIAEIIDEYRGLRGGKPSVVTSILELIAQEIKKVKRTPHTPKIAKYYRMGFEDCRQKILELFNDTESSEEIKEIMESNRDIRR